MVATKGTALSLAKCLLTVWWWSIKVQGCDICPPALMALNIGQFMTWEEVQENVDNSLWFTAYSHTLQRVREGVHGQWWQWPRGKALEVGISPLVRAFWEETGIELTTSCMKLCWELPPRGVFRRRERGMMSHIITYLDDVAVRVPSLNAWDQFVWLPSVAIPQAATEVEQYGYHRSDTVDLGPVMPVTQFRVTDKAGTYLCAVQALVFEGSILAYNPARDKAEWVPARGITNNLSWVEEKSAMALVNYVPRISQEVAHIAGLGTHCLVSWSNSSWRRKSKRQANMRRQRDRGKQAPNHCLAAWNSSKVKWSKRSNHRDDDDHGSGGL